jgi:endonuclease V-like protein UPF0215 family
MTNRSKDLSEVEKLLRRVRKLEEELGAIPTHASAIERRRADRIVRELVKLRKAPAPVRPNRQSRPK